MTEISSVVIPSRAKLKQYLYQPIQYQKQNNYYKCCLTNSVQMFWRVSEYISFRNGNYDLANYNQTFRRVWPNVREINVMRMASQTISAEIEPTDKLEWIMIMLRKFKIRPRVEERRGEGKLGS